MDRPGAPTLRAWRALFAFVGIALSGCSRREPVPVETAPQAPSGQLTLEAPRDAAVSSNIPLEILAPKDADALSTIRTERLRAKAAGRTLVVFAGASWCEPCRAFHEALVQGKLPSLSRITFLEFDADEDRDRLAMVGYAFREIPYFARPKEDGTPAESFSPRTNKETMLSEIAAEVSKWPTNQPTRSVSRRRQGPRPRRLAQRWAG